MIRVLLSPEDSLFHWKVDRVCRDFVKNEILENGFGKNVVHTSAVIVETYATHTHIDGLHGFGVTATPRMLALIRECIDELNGVRHRFLSTIHELGAGLEGRTSNMTGYATHEGARKVAIRRGYKFPICVVVREYEVTRRCDRLLRTTREFKLEN